MHKNILDIIDLKPKVIGCDCLSWQKSWHQIESSQIAAHEKGNTYTGDVFHYCPWCGKKTKLVNE